MIPMMNINTGKLISRNGKIACTCCIVPEYETSCSHSCFHDPEPPDWESTQLYDKFFCVSHAGQNWYSTIDDNLGNTPGVGVSWTTYVSCPGNTYWDSVSPFGGINKSPLYYILSVKNTSTGNHYRYKLTSCCGPFCTANYYTIPDGFAYSVSFSCTETIVKIFLTTITIATGCLVKGSASSGVWQASWRPADCEYDAWNNATDYTLLSCVSRDGKFWRCCIPNGPGTSEGVQEPTGTATGCTGSNYWRLVT